MHPGAGLAVYGDPLEPILAAWLAQVAQRSGSRRTPDTYRREVVRFLASLQTQGQSMYQATPAAAHAFAYAPGPSGRLPAPSTITVRLAAIRSFFDFARRMRLVDANPADDVVRPKTRDPVPRGLDVAGIRQLLEAIPDTKAGRRDRAAIITILLTGLRRAEVFSLRAGDLEGSGEQLTYAVRVKGGHTRRRELPAAAAAAIAEALSSKDLQALTELDPSVRLFPCTPQAFYANLARYARRAGLGRVAPHALRHTAAKLRRDAGGTIEEVQALLGHKSLATTARYLQRLEGETDPGWRRVADLVGL
jgi:site-specific recombinase XerD